MMETPEPIAIPRSASVLTTTFCAFDSAELYTDDIDLQVGKERNLSVAPAIDTLSGWYDFV